LQAYISGQQAHAFVELRQPPTIQSVLESWTASSNVGHGKDRRRFVKEYMSNTSEHILEIVQRQVRGVAQQHGATLAATSSLPALSLLSSSTTLPSSVSFWQSSPNAPHAAQHAQAPVSVALRGLWQMATEFAERAGEERAKVEDRLGNLVVHSLPQNLISKSLDGMFRDWTSSVGLPLPNAPARKK
jgi:20S proteasome subunit alpha 6